MLELWNYAKHTHEFDFNKFSESFVKYLNTGNDKALKRFLSTITRRKVVNCVKRAVEQYIERHKINVPRRSKRAQTMVGSPDAGDR